MSMTDEEKRQLEKEFSEVSSRVLTPKIVKQDDAFPDLFHYTDASGLLGILRSCSLWATHFQSLNDPSEMHYAITQARDLLDSLVEKGPEDKGWFLRDAKELLNEAFEGEGLAPYIVSFCDLGNLLSQWREYGNRGSGFSIGFDFRRLSAIFDTGTRVFKITYDPKVQCDVLSATFEEYWNVLLRWQHKGAETFDLPSAPEQNIKCHCVAQLVSLLLIECATFKNPGFMEEKEWRLIQLGAGDSHRKFRTGRFGIAPYIELKTPNDEKLPIKKVIQGPTADQFSAKRSVEMLLQDYGYAAVEVEVSAIPLRC
jgi:hypothetical protein